MRSTPLRILAFAAAATLPLLAQQPTAGPQSPTGTTSGATAPQISPSQGSGTAQATPTPSTANSPEVTNPQLRPVTGELVTKLDTKSAKTGDSVIVKTTENATTSGGIEIPKGSKIVGHVTDVQAQGQEGDNSRLTIQFDEADIKGGQNMPIRSVIESVSPAGSGGAAAAGSTPAPSSTTSPSTGTSQPAPGASPAAGASQPGSAASAQPAQPGTPAAGTVVATRGNIAIRTTAVPGVFLIGNVTGQPFANAAGALLGAKQDVQLDSGTTMVVAVVAAAPAMNTR